MRAARLALSLGALALAAPTVVFLLAGLAPENALNKDFGQEYLLARAVADGVNPYLPIRALAALYLTPAGVLDKPFPTPHPPSVGVLFLPFALMDYVSAVRVWFVIQIVCLVASVGLLIRETGRSGPFRPRATPLVAFAALGWAPLALDLGLGQLTTPLLLLLVLAQAALVRRRDVSGGVLLGLSLLIKPLAWPLLLVLVVRRRWSSLVAAGLVTACGFGLAGLRVGREPITAYLTSVLPSLSAMYATETTNISLWTVGPRLFRGVEAGQLAGTPPLFASTELASIVGAALPAGVLLVALMWLRTRPPMAIATGVMTCVSVMVNPISWQYYLVLLLLPAWQLLSSLHTRGYPRGATVLAAIVGVALALDGATWRTLARIASGPGPGPDAPVAALLALGPALSAGALGLLLAWLAVDQRVLAREASRALPEVGPPGVGVLQLGEPSPP